MPPESTPLDRADVALRRAFQRVESMQADSPNSAPSPMPRRSTSSTPPVTIVPMQMRQH